MDAHSTCNQGDRLRRVFRPRSVQAQLQALACKHCGLDACMLEDRRTQRVQRVQVIEGRTVRTLGNAGSQETLQERTLQSGCQASGLHYGRREQSAEREGEGGSSLARHGGRGRALQETFGTL